MIGTVYVVANCMLAVYHCLPTPVEIDEQLENENRKVLALSQNY